MRRLPAIILLFAVFAAIDLIFLIRKHEDVIQLLFDGSDASRVLASYHIDNLLWKMETFLVNDQGILDNVDGDVMINESEDVQVNEVYRAFNLHDILLAHLVALGILDDRDTAV